MHDVTRWTKQADLAVNKLCKGMTYEDKQDFKQDCFVALLSASDYLDRIIREGLISPEGAAYTICYNTVVELRRPNSGNKVIENSLSVDALSYEEKGDDSWMKSLVMGSPTEQGLDEAVESLPKFKKYVIRRIYFMGMTEREVAKSVNKSRPWVRIQKTEAVDMLRKFFEKR